VCSQTGTSCPTGYTSLCSLTNLCCPSGYTVCCGDGATCATDQSFCP
jgi:hypothetical protein